MRMLSHLDLFSGIGGFSLGLERTGGFRTMAFCEINEWRAAQLRRLWPGVPVHNDVRRLDGKALKTHKGGRAKAHAQVITAGFPCQDISWQGQGAGLRGERSGLWSEVRRLVAEIRPCYLVLENVPAIRSRGLAVILRQLAALGYDAEWHCIPAAYFGAPHIRDRFWLVAYPVRQRREGRRANQGAESTGRITQGLLAVVRSGGAGRRWPDEPSVARVVHGLPHWARYVRALGDTIVPQAAELIGRAILHAERRRHA